MADLTRISISGDADTVAREVKQAEKQLGIEPQVFDGWRDTVVTNIREPVRAYISSGDDAAPASDLVPFRDPDEMVRAMSSDRYRTSEAFRREVEARVMLMTPVAGPQSNAVEQPQ